MAQINFPDPAAPNAETGLTYGDGWYNSNNGVTYAYIDDTWRTVEVSDTLSDLYVLEAGDTMTGPLILDADPINDLEAATKQYVDTQITTNANGETGRLDPRYLIKNDSSALDQTVLSTGTTTFNGSLVAANGVNVRAGDLIIGGNPVSRGKLDVQLADTDEQIYFASGGLRGLRINDTTNSFDGDTTIFHKESSLGTYIFHNTIGDLLTINATGVTASNFIATDISTTNISATNGRFLNFFSAASQFSPLSVANLPTSSIQPRNQLVSSQITGANLAIIREGQTASNQPAYYTMARSRGDLALGTFEKLEQGDFIGRLNFNGDDGTRLALGASIYAYVSGDVRTPDDLSATTTDLPVSIRFVSVNDNIERTRFTIAHTGNVSIGPETLPVKLYVRDEAEPSSGSKEVARFVNNVATVNRGLSFYCSDNDSAGHGIAVHNSEASFFMGHRLPLEAEVQRNFILDKDGNARFRGTVEPSDITFNLAEDNPDNFTVTIEEYETQEELTPFVPAGPITIDENGQEVPGTPETPATYQTVTRTREVRTYTGPVLDVKSRLQNLISRVDSLEANEITDDATDSALLQLVASLTTRLDQRDAEIAALTARVTTLES